MHKFERLFLGCILGFIPPLIGFLAGWFSTSKFLVDWKIIHVAVGGLAIGLTIDLIWLRKWVAEAYQLDMKIWVAIFIFYSICEFGFFMGVPIFNLVLAIPAGFFIACRLRHNNVDSAQAGRIFFKTKLFTTIVFGLICLASAILALRDSYTAANLEGMFRLNFKVTQPMIIGLIVVGGIVVLAMNWWITGKTIQLTRKWLKPKIIKDLQLFENAKK